MKTKEKEGYSQFYGKTYTECIYDLLRYFWSLRDDIYEQTKEYAWIIGLTQDCRIKFIELLSIGHINGCAISPFNVFRQAFITGTRKIMLVHNHFDRLVEPSKEDISTIRTLVMASKIIGIEFYNSLIFAFENDDLYICDMYEHMPDLFNAELNFRKIYELLNKERGGKKNV